MIRRERAEFLDSVLKLFDGVRTIRKKDLEIKYKEDAYTLCQTEKHLKILRDDGMISDNELDEYHLQPKGLRILSDIESLGYLARHKVAAVEFEEEEQEEKGYKVSVIFDLVCLLFILFNYMGWFK